MGTEDVGLDVCMHCGLTIEPDPENGYRHTDDDVVGCGAPFGEDDPRYAEPAGL